MTHSTVTLVHALRVNEGFTSQGRGQTDGVGKSLEECHNFAGHVIDS